MGLLNKIKDMFFEEEGDDVQINDNRIAKKIELPKRRNKAKEEVEEKEEKKEKDLDLDEEEEEEVKPSKKVLEIEEDEEDELEELEEELEEEEITKKKPIIFDDEDFIEDFVPEKETKEHVLYGGVQKKEPYVEKKKFAPSPIISPVYGVLSKNYQKEDFEDHSKKDLDHLFVDERKKKITFDSVRQKAYGDLTEEIQQTMEMNAKKKEDTESTGLLYDIEDKEEKSPKIESVTMGDAEEYFKDLGLEYNVDYIDASKEHKSRSEKNKKLQEEVKEEAKEEIKEEKHEEEDTDEKNLYDLIDMMYDSNEEE